MFALLEPGAHLNPHRDPFAGSLRYHLGLVTPNSDDCYIVVDGERYSWRDGEAVMFDETFIHWAENKTPTTRIILFCDVERPLTSKIMTRINRYVIENFVKISATQNVEGEPVGALNRFYGKVVHPIGSHDQRLLQDAEAAQQAAFRSRSSTRSRSGSCTGSSSRPPGDVRSHSGRP